MYFLLLHTSHSIFEGNKLQAFIFRCFILDLIIWHFNVILIKVI